VIFQIGPLPKDSTFPPQDSSWKRIWKPGPVMIQVAAVLVFAPVFLWYLNQYGPLDIALWMGLLLFHVILIAHELIHALLFPDGGRSKRTVLGVWASKWLFYAFYRGELSKRRFLVAMLGPLVLLTLVPLVLFGLGVRWWQSEFLILFNFGISLGDVILALCLAFQVPNKAVVRLNDWDVYWRPDQP